jgi:hypothetical protein
VLSSLNFCRTSVKCGREKRETIDLWRRLIWMFW